MVSPPFRPLTDEEKAATADAINGAGPTFVWVGLSAPKQEIWMKDMVGRIRSSVLVGVGAAFPYMAGELKRPPQFVRRLGLEWLFRLCSEPRRLWKRYLQTNSIFVAKLVAAMVRSRLRGLTGKTVETPVQLGMGKLRKSGGPT